MDANYGCRCMRTWRLCFRSMIEKPNALLGWMVPLRQHHIDQYLEDKRNNRGWGALAYYTREGSEFKRCGEVCALVEDAYVYEQYTPGGQQYATGCYGDCAGYRWMLYQKLIDAIRSVSDIPRNYWYDDWNKYKLFLKWRDGWLKRAWVIMWSRKQDCVWAGMPRDLTRWFIENYVDAHVWKCFEYRRAAPPQFCYTFALYPGEMQPSGHTGQTAKEFALERIE